MLIRPTRNERPIPAETYSIPAPVGGWNARDGLANMKEGDAVILDNWFPEENELRVRRGFASHATGMTGTVQSLMAWNGLSSSKLFAAVSDGKIFDVTSAGAVGAAAVSGLSLNKWQHLNFNVAGTNYLYIVNGTDNPRHYDGSSWAEPSITHGSLTKSNLIHLNVFKKRLFFIEKNTMYFYYFPVETISGAITRFDLGPVFKKGGSLMAMGTWSLDAGDGLDDLAVFLTTEGEVAIYKGIDPGTADDWLLVGVFAIGHPIGRRCIERIGADLVIITESGFEPLARSLAGGRLSRRAPLSDKISGALAAAVRDHESKFGWQAIFYPHGNMALFNIPIIELQTSHQYVANTTTGAWCRFKNWNAFCFEVFSEELYFGGTNIVYKADTGEDDNDANVETDLKPSFSYMRKRNQLKNFTMVRPVLATDGDIYVAMDMNVDFEERAPESTPTFTASSNAAWDTATWDVDAWGDTLRVNRSWQSSRGTGYAGTTRMRTAHGTNGGGTIKLHAIDFMYEPGGIL